MGRRFVVMVAAAMLALMAAGGAALADNIEGNGGNNRLVGTNGKDTISGAGGNDDIFGKGGQDRLFGDSGDDELFGQEGNDFANAIDGQANDRVNCGRGANDIAGIDGFAAGDRVAQNCEFLYVATPTAGAADAESGPGADLSAIDTVEEAEAAEAEGLLKQVR